MHEDRAFVVTNAVVHTVGPRDSVAEAILVRDGRIAAVGPANRVLEAADRDVEVIDAQGRTIVPGFIDAHNHMSIAAFEPVSVDCTTPPLATLDEVLSAIETHCRDLPPGQWVRGFGFHESKVAEQRNPTRYELDEVAPNNPFFLVDSSCHAGFANSSALAVVGIDECTPEPWGGMIERDDCGRPTGTLLEAAINTIASASWNDYALRDWDRAVELLVAKADDYLAVGLTGIGDACVTTMAAELYARAAESGRLPLTLQQLHGGDHFFSQQDLRRTDVLDRMRGGESHLLRSGVMKIFADRAFPDGPAIHHVHDGCSQHVGANFYSPREIYDLAIEAAGQGLGLAIHGMGNCAIDSVMDAYEAVRRGSGDGPVLRIEHAFVAEPAQGERLASLGIDLVTNPGLAHTWGDVFATWRGDDQRHLRVLPARSMIDAGARVSFASDHPCGTYSPAQIMWTAVTREHFTGITIDPEEAVTPLEALRAYTINPAHASGRAEEEGSIEIGKRANFVVLDRDPLSCPTHEIREMQVLQTYVDGKLVYRSDASGLVSASTK